MKGWLLDTNVISELRRRRPSLSVIEFIATRAPGTVFVSEVVFAEIRFGIARLQDAGRRARLEAWLAEEIRPRFSNATLRLSEEVLVRWRFMLETCRQSGRHHSEPDLLIAATASHHELTVATRDAGFDRMGLVPTAKRWQGPASSGVSQVDS